MPEPPRSSPLDPATSAFYGDVIARLNAAQLPFLVGGGWALGYYTRIERYTKDFDIFVHRRDYDRVMQLLTAAGCDTQLAFPHWLGKVSRGADFVDVIFSSGNATCPVDDEWFAHAPQGQVLDVPVKFCPVEEMIWSKAFIMERERFDGADILHLLRARAAQLDWARLLRRFSAHWRVLLAHLTMFGFVYPAERAAIPVWVMQELLTRLQQESEQSAPPGRLCHGTLLSREQYLIDIGDWGYGDARLTPHGAMSAEEIALWTAAIGKS